MSASIGKVGGDTQSTIGRPDIPLAARTVPIARPGRPVLK